MELFSDNKRFLELYNALSGQHLKFEETTMEDYVIKDTIYRSLKNDVCKLVNGNLVVLIEHQSTVNKNMPLRCLLYIARIYEMLIPKRERYYRTLRKIPKPEFFVLYTGIDEIEEYEVLKLSDAFESQKIESVHASQLELEVPVINIKPGKNLKILENCNTLKEYSELIEKIHSLLQENEDREEAFKKAIKWGLQKGLLKGYLEQAVTEVLSMLIAEYSYEEDVAAQREEAFEQGELHGKKIGLAEGELAGEHKAKIDMARQLIKDSVSLDNVIRYTGLSTEEIQNILEEYKATKSVD